MIVQRLYLLSNPNRHGPVPCLEALVSVPHGALGWLGRARASLSRTFPTLLPRPAPRTFLPRAAAAELLMRLAKELQRRAGAEPPALQSPPPKLTEGGWQIVIPALDPQVAEAALHASAELIGSFARGSGPEPEEIGARIEELRRLAEARLPSPAAQAFFEEAKRRRIPVELVGPSRVAVGHGAKRRLLEPTDPAAIPAEAEACIPLALVAGPGGAEIAAELARVLRTTGYRVGLASSQRLELPGRPAEPGDHATRQSIARLLADPEVDAAVLELQPEHLEREGLPVDRADVLVAPDLVPEWLEILARETGSPAVVVDPLNPALRRYKGERILVTAAPQGPVSAHLAEGGRALFFRRGVAIAAHGEVRTPLWPTSTPAMLAAAAAAWALNIPLAQTKLSLHTPPLGTPVPLQPQEPGD